MNKNVQKFSAFLTDKEKSIILHALTVYQEKLEFVFKNGSYYDVDDITFSYLKSDYNDIIKLKDKFFSIITIQSISNFREGS